MRRFLAGLIAGLVLALPAYASDVLVDKVAAEAEFKLDILSNFVRSVENQVLSLAGSEFTRRYAGGYREADRAHVITLFRAVAVANTDYMQVRFLDADGRERVRIDRPRGRADPQVIPDRQMQDKGAKSYFQGARALAEGKLRHSNVDLNMEWGEIEKPIRPTFRVSTPVHAGGAFRGVVVINLAMDRILDLLGHSADFDVFMVDRNGEFILHPDPDKAWSRYLPGRGNLDEEFGAEAAGDRGAYAHLLTGVFRNEDAARLILIPNKDFLAGFEGGQDPETRVALTDEEARWIAEHPAIRVHNETDWPPFNFAENGVPKGYSVDFMNLLAKKTGLKVEYVTGPSWNEFLEMMKQGELDVMLNIVKTPERQKYLLYTGSYFENPNVILSHRNKQYGSLEELFGKTVSVPKGFFYEEILRRDYPRINLHLVKNAIESIKAVSYGKADAALGEQAVFTHLIDRHMMTDLIISGEAKTGNPELALLNIAVRTDLPILLSILQKAMRKVSVEEERVLRMRWIPHIHSHERVDLTRQQRRWLGEHPKFSLGIDPAWPPFEFMDRGVHGGIGASYVDIVAKRLGIEMEPVAGLTWSEVMDKARAGEIDILPTVMRSEEREKFLNFTKPYISLPVVIAARKGAPFIGGLAGLDGRKVGVVRDYVTQELLERDHGNLQITPFPTLKDGLDALEDGRIIAFVDNLGAIAYETERAGLENIRISAPTEYNFELAMAVRKDMPELVPILNRVLDTITDQERAAIRNAWINVRVSFGADVRTILTWAVPIGVGAVLVIAAFIFWNHSLTQEITKRREAELNLLESRSLLARQNDLLQAVLDSMAQGVVAFDKDLRLIAWNDHYLEIRDYPKDFAEAGRPFADFMSYDASRNEFGDGDPEKMIQFQIERAGHFDPHQFERQRPDGRFIEVRGGPIPGGGFVSTYTDVTDYKQAEMALAEAEERGRLILESAGEGIFGLDNEGRTVFVNPAACRMLGFEPKELVGQPMHPLIHHTYPDGTPYPREKSHMRAAFREGERRHVTDEVLWRKDGSSVPVEYTSTPIRKDGELVGAVVTCRDITQRKKAETELRDAYAVISSSIDYATHIQRSILPQSRCLEEATSDFFLLWEPRDRVGGDICWCKPWGLGKILALGDCTGHGVPGAFVTMIANGALEMATLETMPGNVGAFLQRIHQLVQESLGQNLNEGNSDDGLELGVCYIAPSGTTMKFAGARFSLFHIDGDEVTEIKGDKCGIGYRGIPRNVQFTSHEVEVRESRSFCMTSDGLIGQVGGPKGQSFGKHRLKDLLAELETLPMNERKAAILRALEDYQGDQKRRDDVSVMGFKL